MRERLRTALFYAVMVLIPLAVIGLGIELGLPRLVPSGALSYHAWGDRPMTLLPGVALHARSQNIDVWLRTNSLGFNDREHARERTPGVRRALLLGDSYVEAVQVRPEAHVARQLEALGAERGRPIEAIAMGADGQGQSHQLANYEVLGRAFAPDVVFAFFCANDPWNNLYRDPLQGGHALYEIGPDGELFPTFAGTPESPPSPEEVSRQEDKLAAGGLRQLVRLVRRWWQMENADPGEKRAARLAALYELPAGEHDAVKEDERAMLEKLVARMKQEIVDRDGHRLIGVIVSGQVTKPPSEAYLALIGWAEETFAHEGVRVVNLDTLFRARAAAEHRQPAFEHDPHWNETGHRWVAEALFDAMQNEVD